MKDVNMAPTYHGTLVRPFLGPHPAPPLQSVTPGELGEPYQ